VCRDAISSEFFLTKNLQVIVMKLFKVLLLSLCLLALVPQFTPGQNFNSANRLRKNEGAIPDHYIVVFNESVPAARVEAFAAQLAQGHGGKVGFTYQSALRGFSVEMSEAQAVALSRNPHVAYVEQDVLVEGAAVQPGAPWGLDRIDQRTLPLDTTYNYLNAGTGANVYIIDSGIRMTHQEFGGRALLAHDNVGDGQNGMDCNGHGTHVAGIIGGSTYGVAKSAKLWSVRVLNCLNQGSAARIIAGMDWVAANSVKPAVANLSFITTTANDTIDLAVRNLVASGVTTVVSAGNNNIDAGTRSPARVTEAITVAASDMNDNRASFSNYGAVVDVFAPGVDIVSAASVDDTATNIRSGTSSAAPFVAGTAALYLESYPVASPASVAAAITDKATTGIVTNPGIGSPNRLLYSLFIERARRDNRADFDGDYKTDISILNPGTPYYWTSLNSSNGQYVSFSFGQSGDIAVPGDYNGDGKTDRAVFRPSNGNWYIATDMSGAFYGGQFGISEDIPVARDYDGDGKTDMAVFRPSTNYWYILNSSTNSMSYVQLGQGGDRPVPGDYDGDGKDDLAMFRPSVGDWWILKSSNNSVSIIHLGLGSDWPVQADYDGDGKTDIAVFRPGAGEWYILNSTEGSATSIKWGQNGDLPVPGDYDGDGRANVAVYRNDGNWYILNRDRVTYSSKLFFTGVPTPTAYLPKFY
jgi:subtilisin family serine protease